jgi:glucose-1-phosphate thymidylyltransferase
VRNGDKAYSALEIVGLIPAGGEASRMGPLPCSKELIPVGFRGIENGSLRPKVVSQYLLEKYRLANASKAYFIIRKGKWDIPNYFGDGRMCEMDVAYLIMDLPHGVPYTLDQASPFVKNARVLLGFPDILFEPQDAYLQTLKSLEESGADIVLGLFRPKDARQMQKSDMVEWDEQGPVGRILVKPTTCTATYAWILAAWTPAFTRFMHEYLKTDRIQRAQSSGQAEIHMGHVIQTAIDEGLRVHGHAFPEHRYLDIGTPDDLAEAYTRCGVAPDPSQRQRLGSKVQKATGQG